MSDTPSIVPAVVVEQTTGDPIGNAAAMSYTLRVQFPWGPERVEGVRPVIERWTDINVRAIAPNTVVPVGIIDGHLQLIGRELPDRQPCPDRARVATLRSKEVLDAIRHMSEADKSELRGLLA